MDPTRSDPICKITIFWLYIYKNQYDIPMIYVDFYMNFTWLSLIYCFTDPNPDPCHDTDPDAGGPKWYGYLTLYSRIKHAMTHKEKRYICNQCNYRCVQVPFCVHVPYCVQLPFCVQVPCAGISQVTLELHWLQRYRFSMCFSRPKSAAACHSKVLSLHPRMLFIERLI